jgi:hypothetical protein
MAQRTIFDFVTPATVPMQLVFPPVTATFETARERRNRLARERRARNRAQQQVDLRSAPTYGQVQAQGNDAIGSHENGMQGSEMRGS